MYTIPEPRTLDQVLRLITPEDGPHHPTKVFDAMRTWPQFYARTFRDQPTHNTNGNEYNILGHRRSWTSTDAEQTLIDTFGKHGPDQTVNLVAFYRDQPVDALDDTFMFAIAILIWGGTTIQDAHTWQNHDPANTNGEGLGYACPAYWIARWGKESLNALVAAGITYPELNDIYGSGTLPNPNTIATLAALRTQTV